MTGTAEHQQKRGWARGGMLALLVGLMVALAALPGVASAGSANSAHLTSPLGQTLGSPSQTFTWSAGTGVSEYWLYVGTNVGAYNIYNSGGTTALSATATNLPANGSRISVRLWSLIGGVWQYNDYSFAAAQPVIADLTSPAPNSILSGTTVDFQWNAVASQGYWVYVGSTPGGSQYCNSGSLPQATTDFSCAGLPSDGSTVYVRLWTNVGTPSHPIWYYHDYAFTASGAIIPTVLPNPGGSLGLNVCTALFSLSTLIDVTPTNATSVLLSAGTTGPGSTDLYATASVPLLGSVGLSLGSASCPATGDSITIYVRLTYKFGPIWYHNDYTFVLLAVDVP